MERSKTSSRLFGSLARHMNITRTLEKLIMLAWYNNQHNERLSSWEKARSILTREGLGYASLGTSLADLCTKLDTLFSLPPIAQQSSKTKEQQQHTQQGPRTSSFDWAEFTRRYQRYTTHKQSKAQHIVQQPHATRAVDDKAWDGLTCKQCGAPFAYEAYPGNPRRYCSPECKARYLRNVGRARMRARRSR